MPVTVTLFGILLPLLTLMVELGTDGCAELFFNPIPTLGHMVLIALVPVANSFALIYADPESKERGWRWGMRLNGMGLGITAIYGLMFIPLIPMGVIGLLYGLGIFVLAPPISFFVILAPRNDLMKREASNSQVKPTSLCWVGVGCLLLLVVESPGLLTRVGMSQAISDNTQTKQRGHWLLEKVATTDEVLQDIHSVA